MFRKLCAGVVIGVWGVCATAWAQPQQIETAKIPISGAWCPCCVEEMLIQVKAVQGVDTLSLNLPLGYLRVIFDAEQTSVKSLVETINVKTNFHAGEPDRSDE